MDFSFITHTFTPDFFVNLFTIVIIDLVLAGDNSIVIAMAVQGLSKDKRLKGILFGALAAVGLRVIFTFFASKMLTISFVKLIGGGMIFWIALKLMADSHEDEHKKTKNANSVWNAVWIILIADFTMSLDNILAVAGASHGSLLLLIFGLGLSIPLVVFTSSLISKLMERFKFIIWIGAAILGKVGAEMIFTDPIMIKYVLTPNNLIELKNGLAHANHYLIWTVESLGAISVILITLLRKSLSRTNTKATV